IRVHLVNNLLQLSEENTTSEGHEWFCRGNLLDNAVLGEKKWFAATQEELDSIAVRLTWLEQQLMQGGSVDAEDHRQPKLAILERIRSQHACPFLGNYSFEVVTEALGRRGVGLQFVRPAEVTLGSLPHTVASKVWRPLPACELVEETCVLAMQLCLSFTRPVAASWFEAFGIGIYDGNHVPSLGSFRNRSEKQTRTVLQTFESATSLAYPSLARTEGEASSVTKTFWGAIMVHDEGERYPTHLTASTGFPITLWRAAGGGGSTKAQLEAERSIGAACYALNLVSHHKKRRTSIVGSI
ncbi:hypothetical protein THAOC_27992, partial [Thalassiosira oceanica]